MADPKQMTLDERRRRAYHEAGHAAIVYWLGTWRGEALQNRPISLYGPRFFNQHFPVTADPEATELDLMVLIAGPLAELLSMDIVPKRAIRVSADYDHPLSDSTRMRNLVRSLRASRDHQPYQFEVQERVRAILQSEPMWQALTAIAEKLTADAEVEGTAMRQVFESRQVPTRPPDTPPTNTAPVQLGLGL